MGDTAKNIRIYDQLTMDRKVKCAIGVTLMAVLLMGIPSAIMASSGGEHGEATQHHGFNLKAFLGKTLNATILFGGLILFLRKPIIKLLTQKSLDVKNDIIQREVLLKKTTLHLEDIQKRLDRIEEEVIAMKKSAIDSGNEEKKRIEELGNLESQRIMEITNTEISTKVENAVRDLKAKIADLTIAQFKKDFESKLDKKTHEKIIEKNIDICGAIIERE